MILLVVILPGVLYARGLQVWRTQPRPMAWWRPHLFYGGLFLNFLALGSPIDALGDDLFFIHMVQHFMLQMLAVPLLLLGAPTTPMLLGLPRGFRQRVVRRLVRNAPVRTGYGLLTSPPVAWLLFAATNWAWHLVGGAYDQAVQHGGIHLLQHFTFVGSALLVWLTIVDPKPMRSRLSYPFRMVFLLAMMFQNIYLGASITLRDTLLYDSYASGPGLWGLSPLEDQQSGGAFMWVAGDTLMVIAMVVTGVYWYQHERAKARREEALREKVAKLPLGPGGRPVQIMRPKRMPSWLQQRGPTTSEPTQRGSTSRSP